jgi:hypothetical protein
VRRLGQALRVLLDLGAVAVLGGLAGALLQRLLGPQRLSLLVTQRGTSLAFVSVPAPFPKAARANRPGSGRAGAGAA